MEPVSFAFAVGAAAELCLKTAREFQKHYDNYIHAETEIRDRMLHVSRQCYVIHFQLDFMRGIEQSLTNEHKAIQRATFEMYTGRLEIVWSKLNSLLKTSGDHPTKIRKIKYVLCKSALDEAITDLDRWQKDYDPSWFLLVKVAGSHIDVGLEQSLSNISAISAIDNSTSVLASAKVIRECSQDVPRRHVSVFLPEAGLQGAHFHSIDHCAARYLQVSGQWFLVDTIKCSAFADPSLTLKDVRALGSQLSRVDPFRFGILQCYGIVRHREDNSTSISSFDFVFEAPGNISKKPMTLRSNLTRSTTHTLTKRFEAAMQLAKSVCYVHTLGFVHKNVRPENVVSFPTESETLPSFFLIGFDQARILERGTTLAGDSVWEKNMYRHPDRQGLNPKESYTMQHDIYSLGVCLLELGLWKSFVEYDQDNKARPSLQLGLTAGDIQSPVFVKEHLTAMAKDLLPIHVGELYSSIVVNCLTCLDPDNVDFGDQREFEDEDEILVGVKYIEKILLKLNSLRV